MRISIVRTVFLKELREMLRDRRSLIVMFGLPLVLYPLLALGIATLETSKKKELNEHVANVVMSNAGSAPHLRHMLDQADSGVRLVPLPVDVTLHDAIATGKVDAAITVPPSCEKQALAGQKVDVRVMLDRSRTNADFVDRKLKKVVEEYQRWVIEKRLEARHVPPTVLEPVTVSTEDIANPAQLFGHLLAQALPVLLMMTGMLGALFPALNATTTERELGTLEALLLTPARRFELLTAKGLLVLLCALLTAALNMASMSLVLLRSFTLASGGAQKLSISPGMLALSYLAAVPALIFFSAIVLIVGLVARNFREANSFATPVMLIPLASFAVAMMEPRATPALLITPVANTTIVIREVLTGRAAPGQFLLAFGSSCLYAGIILSLAGRLFSSEQLVNPAWEPLSLKLFGRGTAKGPRRLPAVDEALVLFCVVLLLLFYVSPSFISHGLIPAAVGNELLLILAPTVIFALIARWDWVKTFSFRRPTGTALVAAAFLGVGLSPWAQFAQVMQERLWPRDPQIAKAEGELFIAALQAHPILTVVLIPFLAGICEEFLFRGPVQVSFLRRVPAWAAIIFTAVLFSVAHLDVHGFVIRAALGAAFGWIVWRSGSIFPAMLAHFLYDASQLAVSSWEIHQESLHGQVTTTLALSNLDYISLAIGAVAIIAAIFIWRRGNELRNSDDPKHGVRFSLSPRST
jgi:sodium transport system permease protein